MTLCMTYLQTKSNCGHVENIRMPTKSEQGLCSGFKVCHGKMNAHASLKHSCVHHYTFFLHRDSLRGGKILCNTAYAFQNTK